MLIDSYPFQWKGILLFVGFFTLEACGIGAPSLSGALRHVLALPRVKDQG
jgi:hypothetical protein